MIKIVIANDNDILFYNISEISLQKKLNIEIQKISNDELFEFINKIKVTDKLIMIDSITLTRFYISMFKNIISQQTKNLNIIILVSDFRNIPNNIANKNKNPFIRNKDVNILSLIDIITNTLEDAMEIERTVDMILWKLGFTYYFKGTTYLKDAILMVYHDKNLLSDSQNLMKEIAKKNNIHNHKAVRSNIDRSLNSMLDSIDINTVYKIFDDDYDGRKISLKYFINLCIRYLEKNNCKCLI